MNKKNIIKLSTDEIENILFLKKYNNQNKFNKLCLLSHFDINNTIEQYVIHMIKELHKLKFDIVFITTSENMNIKELKKISSYIKISIIKKNIGYDFISWKTALYSIGNYERYKQIIHLNDSIFFPLYNPKNMFKKMKNEKVDFWGLSDSYYLDYHIQSFFWVFNKKLIKSDFYNKFWNECTDLNDKGKIIKNYEITFTRKILNNNFKVSSFIKIKNIYEDLKFQYKELLPLEAYTGYYHFWDILISNFKSIYLKKNILLENNLTYNIGTETYEDIINNYTTYNPKLISKYVKKHNQMKLSSFIDFDKSVNCFEKLIESQKNKNKIIIYGYSHIGILMHSILGSKIIQIVDINFEEINKRSKVKFDIQNPDMINKIDYDSIVICSIGREDDVLKNLNSKGIYKNIFKLENTQKENLKFSGNMTKLIRNIETMDLEKQKNHLNISIYNTNNPLLKYLLLYNNFKNLSKINIINEDKYLNKNNIIFQIYNKIKNETRDVEFYPV